MQLFKNSTSGFIAVYTTQLNMSQPFTNFSDKYFCFVVCMANSFLIPFENARLQMKTLTYLYIVEWGRVKTRKTNCSNNVSWQHNGPFLAKRK